MDAQHVKDINKMLDKLDTFLSTHPQAEALYQILSGSLRGPDNGVGKSCNTMRLRYRALPRTCTTGHTGMMWSKEGEPEHGTSELSHYSGHTSQAMGYLKMIDRYTPESIQAILARERE